MAMPSVTHIKDFFAPTPVNSYPPTESVWGTKVDPTTVDMCPRQVRDELYISNFFDELQHKSSDRVVSNGPFHNAPNNREMLEYTAEQMDRFGAHVVVMPIERVNHHGKDDKIAWQEKTHNVVCVLGGKHRGRFITFKATSASRYDCFSPKVIIPNNFMIFDVLEPAVINSLSLHYPLIQTVESRLCNVQVFEHGSSSPVYGSKIVKRGVMLDPFYPYSETGFVMDYRTPQVKFADRLAGYIEFLSEYSNLTSGVEISGIKIVDNPQKIEIALDLLRSLQRVLTPEDVQRFNRYAAVLKEVTNAVYYVLAINNSGILTSSRFAKPLVKVVSASRM